MAGQAEGTGVSTPRRRKSTRTSKTSKTTPSRSRSKGKANAPAASTPSRSASRPRSTNSSRPESAKASANGTAENTQRARSQVKQVKTKTKQVKKKLNPVSVGVRRDCNEAARYVAEFSDGRIEAPIAGASLFMPENHSFVRKAVRRVYRYVRRSAVTTFNSTRLPRTVRTFSVLIIFYVAIVLVWNNLRDPLPEVRLASESPFVFSAENSYEDLKFITADFHPSSSDYNLVVRRFLAHRLRDLQSTTDRVMWVQEDNNTNLEKDGIFFEGANVMVRLLGKDHMDALKTNTGTINETFPALLMNAHYDSSGSSYGATDCGVPVVSLLELLRTLIHKEPLKHDLVLMFNDGEEGGLYGAAAFTHNPWYKDIATFVNLEGAGTAHDVPYLFRANSFKTVKKFTDVPFPKASVMLQAAMSVVGSDTDFSVFTRAGLTGIDVANANRRQFYHSTKDDIAHVDIRALQAIGDNLIVLTRNILNEENTEFPHEYSIFYDLLGRTMVVTSNLVLNIWLCGFLACLTILSAVYTYKSIVKNGLRKFIFRNVRYTLESFLFVTFYALSTISLIFVLARIKFHFNRKTSYVESRFNLIWIVFAVLTWMLMFENVWTFVSSKVGLRKGTKDLYISLPAEESGSRSNSPNRGRNGRSSRATSTNRGPHSISATETAFEDEHSFYSDDDDTLGQTGRRIALSSDAEDETHDHAASSEPIHATPANRSPSLSPWLPYGTLAFWGLLILISIILSTNGIHMGLYFIPIYAGWSLVAVSTMAIAAALLKLTRPADGSQKVSFLHKAVKLYSKQSWAPVFLISSLIPSLYLADLINFVSSELPTQTLESSPSWEIDLAIGALVILFYIPSLGPLARNITRHLFTLATFSIFLIFYIYCLTPNKTTTDKPQRVLYTETWDISTSSSARTSQVDIIVSPLIKATTWGKENYRKEELDFYCINQKLVPYGYGVCSLADFRPPNIADARGNLLENPDDLISISINDVSLYEGKSRGAKDLRDLKISVQGPPKSRTCSFNINQGFFEGMRSGSAGKYDFVKFNELGKGFFKSEFKSEVDYESISTHNPRLDKTLNYDYKGYTSMDSFKNKETGILERYGLISHETPDYPRFAPGMIRWPKNTTGGPADFRKYRRRVAYHARDYTDKKNKRAQIDFFVRGINRTEPTVKADNEPRFRIVAWDEEQPTEDVSASISSSKKANTLEDDESPLFELEVTCIMPADTKNSEALKLLNEEVQGKGTVLGETTMMAHKLSRPQLEHIYDQVYQVQKRYDDNLRDRLKGEPVAINANEFYGDDDGGYADEFTVAHALAGSKKLLSRLNNLNPFYSNKESNDEVVGNIASTKIESTASVLSSKNADGSVSTESKEPGHFLQLNRPSLRWKWLLDHSMGSYTGGMAIHRKFRIYIE